MHGDHKLKLFACRSSRPLAEKIAEHLGVPVGQSDVLTFSDGEFQPAYLESVRGCSVFIVQSTPPPTENIMELLMMIDAAKRASAHNIVAVIPYFGFARQDRKDRPRVSIGAKLVADLLRAAGVNRVMTVDLHAGQIQGFFDVPVDHLMAGNVFLPYIKTLHLENLSIASPDMGGAKRAHGFAKALAAPMIICHKSREKANEVASITAIGDVKGRDVLIVDDMIDTAGTLTKAANVLFEMGATSVRACATHAVLSGEAYERIEKSALTEVIVTDTLPIREDKPHSKITVLSMAEIIAHTIDKVYNYEPISPDFIL